MPLSDNIGLFALANVFAVATCVHMNVCSTSAHNAAAFVMIVKALAAVLLAARDFGAAEVLATHAGLRIHCRFVVSVAYSTPVATYALALAFLDRPRSCREGCGRSKVYESTCSLLQSSCPIAQVHWPKFPCNPCGGSCARIDAPPAGRYTVYIATIVAR